MCYGTEKFKTDSSIPVKRSYSKRDVKRKTDDDPGNTRSHRGLYPNMYRERLWTMRQYSGFGSAEETNKRFKFLLEHGQTGLSLAFDLPTQTGRDSDDPQSEGEVGRTGVAISSIKDMMTCFEGIPLDKVSTSMTINSTASTLLVALHHGCRIARRDSGQVKRDNAERHSEGIHCPEHLHLPSKAIDANHSRHD